MVTSQPLPERGDLVRVEWRDIYEDVTGDPDRPQLARRTSFGLFWGSTVQDGIPCIVTTTTRDEQGTNQLGYCIYPSSCVVKLTIVKKARRLRKRSVNTATGSNTAMRTVPLVGIPG